MQSFPQFLSGGGKKSTYCFKNCYFVFFVCFLSQETAGENSGKDLVLVYLKLALAICYKSLGMYPRDTQKS